MPNLEAHELHLVVRLDRLSPFQNVCQKSSQQQVPSVSMLYTVLFNSDDVECYADEDAVQVVLSSRKAWHSSSVQEVRGVVVQVHLPVYEPLFSLYQCRNGNCRNRHCLKMLKSYKYAVKIDSDGNIVQRIANRSWNASCLSCGCEMSESIEDRIYQELQTLVIQIDSDQEQTKRLKVVVDGDLVCTATVGDYCSFLGAYEQDVVGCSGKSKEFRSNLVLFKASNVKHEQRIPYVMSEFDQAHDWQFTYNLLDYAFPGPVLSLLSDQCKLAMILGMVSVGHEDQETEYEKAIERGRLNICFDIESCNVYNIMHLIEAYMSQLKPCSRYTSKLRYRLEKSYFDAGCLAHSKNGILFAETEFVHRKDPFLLPYVKDSWEAYIQNEIDCLKFEINFSVWLFSNKKTKISAELQENFDITVKLDELDDAALTKLMLDNQDGFNYTVDADFKDYILNASNIVVQVVDDEANDMIQNYFLHVRSAGMAVNIQLIDKILRLAVNHARLQFRNVVYPIDVRVACALMDLDLNGGGAGQLHV